MKTVGNLGSLPKHMMGLNDSLLIKELSDAQKQLYLDHPTYMKDLEDIYYGNIRAADDLLLTREEYDYIKAARPLFSMIIP